MAATSVVLDPSGYKYPSEPGAAFRLTGSDLWRKASADDPTRIASTRLSSLYNPPGSQWLMVRPQQLTPAYFDPAIAGHEFATYRLSEFLFASGFVPREADLARKAGSLPNVNSDYWITIPQTPSSITGLDAVNYGAMDNSIGCQALTNFKTVAFAYNTPARAGSAQPLNEADYTPCFRWLSQPHPDTTVVFGWSNYAIVCTNETVYVLRSPLGDKQTWELMGSVAPGMNGSPFWAKPNQRGQAASMMAATTLHGITRQLTVVPVGPDKLYIYSGNDEPLPIKIIGLPEGSTHDNRLMMGGTFWLGMGPSSKLTFQLQCVSYYSVAGSSLGYPSDTSGEFLVDLGKDYQPTQAPTLWLQRRFQQFQGIGVVDTVSGSGPNTHVATGGQQVDWTLLDESGATWASDGTHNAAFLKLKLTPGNPVAGMAETFLAPQVRGVQVRFPVYAAARVNSALTLTDTQFSTWRMSASLDDPDAKKLTVVLTPEQADLLTTSGHDARTGYPIQIKEGSTIRAAGWVREPRLQELKVENGGSRTIPLRLYTLEADGLLSGRMDKGWTYLPELLDPSGEGYIEHTFLIAECLRLGGFDVADTAVYEAATDLLAGTSFSRVPSTWAETQGTDGTDDAGAWNPKWDQRIIEYLQQIATQFAGWSLYENLAGKVHYHPNPRLQFLMGGHYYSSATIYRTKAAAAAASVPGQYMLDTPTREVIHPTANVVRITGKEADGTQFPHVVDSLPETWTTITDPNFVGEPRPYSFEASLATQGKKVAKLARLALRQLAHKRRRHVVQVPLAPWQMGPNTVAPGYIVTLEGSTRSECLITHLEVELLHRDVYRTTLTCERLPAGSTVHAIGDCNTTPYPGMCQINFS